MGGMSSGKAQYRHQYYENSKALFSVESEPLRPSARRKTDMSSYDSLSEVGLSSTGLEWAPWGLDDNLPYVVRRKLELNDMALPALYKRAAILFGNGVAYYRNVIQDGVKKREFFIDREIEQFLEDSNIERFVTSRLIDYLMHYNVFNSFVLSNNRQRIAKLEHLPSEWSRLEKAGSAGWSQHLFYSAYWGVRVVPTKDQYQTIPLVDYENKRNWMQQFRLGRGNVFAHHSFFARGGRAYYGMNRNGGLVRKDGWLDVANDIPEIIAAMHRNQISLKYHVRIPMSYWRAMHDEWDTYTPEEREELQKEKQQEMNEFLAGKDNTLKSFVTTYGLDGETGIEVQDVQIVAVDDKTKKDAYIPNSNAADSKIAIALGLDPSELGLQPQGGKMGAGSGSDKREARNNAITLTPFEQAIIFEPLKLVAMYNGWDLDGFTFTHTIPTTLNNNPTGLETLDV